MTPCIEPTFASQPFIGWRAPRQRAVGSGSCIDRLPLVLHLGTRRPIELMPRRLPCFEIRSSPIQGRGAFAIRRLRRGTRLIEYQGERIGSEQAAARYDDDRAAHPHVLLFIVDDDTLIDAG